MSATMQYEEEKCPKCGKHTGIWEGNYYTNDEWFACLACGWRYQNISRTFGKNLLSELRDVISMADPAAWTVELDEILTIIADQCVENGWPADDDTLNFPVKLRDIVSRDFSERNSKDWDFVVYLSRHGELFVYKDRKVVYDYTEKAPFSEPRPVEEFTDLLNWKREKSKPN